MSDAPTLYQEARLSPTPTLASQVLEINTTGEQQQSHSFGAGRKRGFEEISGLDEEGYARKFLATEGSVFFRRKSRAPRSFLWRVLEGRKVLEIQSVDLVHEKSAKSESWLTFRVNVPGEILQNGVALADPDEADALEAYVLTSRNELFTITLKRDLLTRETAPSDFDAKTCVKKHSSNSLAFRRPYRFVAVSSLELLLSLHDGGMMRLQRKPTENGAQWRETFFSEGGWSGTLRGLIPLKRHQTIRYGNLELEPNAVAAMAKSPDGNYIWTVSLDHELKAWGAHSGKKLSQRDLLNERFEEDDKKHQKFVMGAEQGTLLQIIRSPPNPGEKRVAKLGDDGSYCMVIYSPKDHQFKFYQVSTAPSETGGEMEMMRVEDLHPAEALIPPIDELMNTNIWHLEEFYVLPGIGWRDTQLWLRARSGSLCRVFTLTFDLFDKDGEAADLELTWQCGWTVVDSGMQTIEAIRESVDFPGDLDHVGDTATTPSEKWLEFLFKPGRFSMASIETALHIYRKGRGLPAGGVARGLNAPEPPLKERLKHAITSKILLRRLPNDQPDYDRYQLDIQGQWKTFFSLLSHLHNRRNESLGFAFDFADHLPWTVSADFVAPVRANGMFENLCLNEHLLADENMAKVEDSVVDRVFPGDEALLLSHLSSAVKDFSSRLSADFREGFNSYVLSEVLSHESGDEQANRKRVQALYDVHNLHSEVMDDDFQALENAAENFGGLGNLSPDTILGIVELLHAEPSGKNKDNKTLNRYGDKLLVAVAQETLERDRGALLDLLRLVVFMYGDLDQNELHDEFVAQIGELYDAIIVKIKHNEMLSWLAKSEGPEPARHHRSSRIAGQRDAEVSMISLLERIAIGDWDPKSNGRESLPELLTLWSKQWIYAADLYEGWDGITGYILAFLVKEQYYELATDFQRFILQGDNASSWSRYLEGRLLLATGDYAHATLKFRDAADDMAQASAIAAADTTYLLSDEERNYFGSGRSTYYQHVAAMFEKLQAYSYNADFARLALDSLEGAHYDRLDELQRMSSSTDSPNATRVNAAQQELRLHRQVLIAKDELHSRLFTALVQTGRFREAFGALASIENLPMKKGDLGKLIETCVKQGAVQEMLDLPFKGSQLVQEADAILLSLAKKGLASGSAGTPPYHQILYAFRTQRADFRGAAEILYEHLERLRHAYRKHGMRDPEDETLIQAYVLLINTLACCGEEDAWLLADPIADVHGAERKRRLVRIADVRREYGAELDKRSDILQGRFPLVGEDEMDVF